MFPTHGDGAGLRETARSPHAGMIRGNATIKPIALSCSPRAGMNHQLTPHPPDVTSPRDDEPLARLRLRSVLAPSPRAQGAPRLRSGGPGRGRWDWCRARSDGRGSPLSLSCLDYVSCPMMWPRPPNVRFSRVARASRDT